MKFRSALFFVVFGALMGGVLRAATPTVRFSTFLGGSGIDIPEAVAVDASGATYIAGLNGSSDFPNAHSINEGNFAFVAKVSPDGSTIPYATLFNGCIPRAIAVDGLGQIYVAGHTIYNDFPVSTNAFQTNRVSENDAVILKFNAAGDQILFATYLGGAGDDAALGIAVDPQNGDIWVTGITSSIDFPTAGQPLQGAKAGSSDAFLAKISNDGATLKYATFFGAPGGTYARGIALDSLGRPVICGSTAARDLPMVNAYQSTLAGEGGFVTKFDALGQSILLSTFLDGGAEDSAISVALDAAGFIYVEGLTQSSDFPVKNAFHATNAGGGDIYLAKLTPDGSGLVYGTFVGSTFVDTVNAWPYPFGSSGLAFPVASLAVTPGGRALVVGTTQGWDFPLVNALKGDNDPYAFDATATLFEADGTVGFSTYLGGRGDDFSYAAALGPNESFVLAGYSFPGTTPPNFPVTPGAAQTSENAGPSDVFVIKLDLAGPPLSNDNLAAAAVIPGMTGTFIAQTDQATKEPNEPNHAGNAGGKSVWYRWTAPAAGELSVRTRASDFATLLALYHGNDFGNLQLVASGESEARQAVSAGETILIAVDGKDGASGTLYLSVTLSVPPNDDFANRATVAGTSATVFGSNVGATGEEGDYSPTTVWWKWTAPVSGEFTLNAGGSSFPTWLTVYDGLTADSRLTANSGYTNGISRLTFRAQAGSEYEFLVYGQDNATGSIQLNLAPAIRPFNDDFAARPSLTNRNEFVSGSDFDAVFDPAEFALEALAGIVNRSGRMIWWEWIAPIDGAVMIDTAGSYRLANATDEPNTSIVLFAGDSFPTDERDVQAAFDASGQAAASLYVTEVHANTHYQIGLGAPDWEQPAQFSLSIRAIAPPRIIAGSPQLSGGVFHARGEGTAGKSYRVKSSIDLANWNLVSEHLEITGEFAFEAPVTEPHQFFRIEEIP